MPGTYVRMEAPLPYSQVALVDPGDKYVRFSQCLIHPEINVILHYHYPVLAILLNPYINTMITTVIITVLLLL